MVRNLLKLGTMATGVLIATGGGAGEARAQYPGTGVVYETVAPAQNTVTYGEQTRVRYKRNKTVIRERPVAYVTRTPAVVRETRYVQQAPVVESRLVQPAPVLESRYVQPAPVLESRYVQPAPVVERVFVQPDPVVQTRYISRYPY